MHLDILNWFRKRRQKRLRQIDLDEARAAFALHVYADLPWTALGNDEIVRVLEGLK